MQKPFDAQFHDMVWRIDSRTFEVRGLPNGATSPLFASRREAELWITENLCNGCRTGSSSGSFSDPVRPVILRRA